MVEIGTIMENKKVAKDIWSMRIKSPGIAGAARPGQFVNLRLTQGLEPLLRRPISLNDINGGDGTINLLYLVVGEGTRLMTEMEAGGTVDVLGPLGKGFNLDTDTSKPVLVGGGIGIAPLYPLAVALIAGGKSVTLIAGSKTKEYLADIKRFEDAGVKVYITTDDGSDGHHGFVTDVLGDLIKEKACDYIYACGPLAMLRAVDALSQSKEIDGEVSAEAHMGCGLGVCLLCANKRRSGGYAMTCTDGPVFKIGELAYEEC